MDKHEITNAILDEHEIINIICGSNQCCMWDYMSEYIIFHIIDPIRRIKIKRIDIDLEQIMRMVNCKFPHQIIINAFIANNILILALKCCMHYKTTLIQDVPSLGHLIIL